MSVDLSTYVLDFGRKHAGTRIQRVPASYLLWMVREKAGPHEIAQAELDRRGISIPEVEISHHAIDTASLRILKTWHENRGENEGLHAWLCRAFTDALRDGEPLDDDRGYAHLGVRWVVEEDGTWPLLKTVMRDTR